MEAAARERRERLAALRGDRKQPDSEPSHDATTVRVETVEERAEKILNQAASEPVEQPSLHDLAPKSVSEDLKHYLQPRLDELEEQTQEAILEFVKQRISAIQQQQE